MNLWLIGATALLAGLGPCLLVALRAPLLDALVAAELAGTVTTIALVLLTEGYHRSSYFTLPIALPAANARPPRRWRTPTPRVVSSSRSPSCR